VPNLQRISEVNEKVLKEGIVYRNYDEEYHSKNLGGLSLFCSTDLEDCVRPVERDEIDQSIYILRKDLTKQQVSYIPPETWHKINKV